MDRDSGIGASQADQTSCAVRSAVHAELVDLLSPGGAMRRVMRGEVDAALKSWGGWSVMGQDAKGVVRVDSRDTPRWDAKGVLTEHSNATDSSRGSAGGEIRRTVTADHFSKVVRPTCRLSESDREAPLAGRTWLQGQARLWTWLQGLEEPPHTGCLARLVTSRAFDMTVNVMILINCVFMVYAAEVQIKDPNAEVKTVLIGDSLFLVFYTVEMVLKLVVHRQWFFWNKSCKVNTFDFFLVVSSLLTVSVGHWIGIASPQFLRLLRLFKFGRAIRAIRVMSNWKHLRALLVCLHGSFSSLFYSLVMLFSVYAIFSLFLIQIVVTHLQETGEVLEETDLGDFFGSFGVSMLTLYKASTGGDDWSVAYRVIEPTGDMGCVTYLFFIAFVHFALINIITGIFVESAMKTLSPDSETLALEHSLQEAENAKKLEHLCSVVDVDASGKLTLEKIEDGLRRKHIPLLLDMLGLQKHNILEFFNYMAEVSDDDGQVQISTFVRGCMLLKGAATNFDLQKLHADFKALQSKHDQDTRDILNLLHDRLKG